jgi:hypothetical protein
MTSTLWAVAVVALVLSATALGLSALLTTRYRQLVERVAAGSGAAHPMGPRFPALGSPAPEFAAFAADGSRVDTNSISQPGAVAVFLDTKCATCKDYLPEISGFLAQRAADGPAPLAVISGDREEFAWYVAALPDSVRVVGQPSGDLARAFGVQAFPTVLLYDDGKVSAAGPRPSELVATAR